MPFVQPPALVSRILVRIETAERREPDPHYRDDYRIAWIAVLRAARGEAQPHIAATYAVLGIHPEKVWAAIVERRRALLGSLYEEFWGGGPPPKKPSRSVGLAVFEREKRAA